MKNLIIGLIFLLTLQTATAQSWLFPFPLIWGERTLGEIDAYSDGITVGSINVEQLTQATEQLVNAGTLDALRNLPDEYVTVEQLKQMGIAAEFNSSDQSINLVIDESAAADFLLSFGSKYEPAQYSESAFWTMQNTFNASTDYTLFSDSDSENTQTWLGEWLVKANIGGVRGANIDVSGFITDGDDIDSDVYRGEARLFFDEPSTPWRLTFGDVTQTSAGHLPSTPLGGVAFERLYQDLQPTRNIQNGGTQPLVLNESADVEIYINDIFLTEIRLPPGRYTLDDLPLVSGTNDVRLDISYQSGRTDTIVYSQFFNSRLLREGISDFGFYSGLISTIEDNNFKYDDEQWVTSGYYDYGISDTLTLGVNGLYHPDGQQLGVIATIGSDWGNLGLRASAQNNKPNDETGSIYSLDYSHQLWGTDSYGSPNFRLGAEYQDQYFSLPWQIGPSATGVRVFSNYVFTITDDLNLILTGDYRDFEEEEIEWLVSSEIAWQWYSLSLSAGVEKEENPNDNIDETRFTFSADWDWNSVSGEYNANVSYSNEPDTYRAQFQRPSDDYTGSYGYAMTAEGDADSQTYSVEGDYVANRFIADAKVSHLEFDNTDSYQTASLRASTALTLADGNLAWSRPINGPVAIVAVHDSLDADVEINAVADDPAEAISTSTINNAVQLSGGHQLSSIYINVPDAPVGYDFGDHEYNITPGSQTGHLIKIGSAASKTIIGTIELSQNKPLKLFQGQLVGQQKTYDFFTNRSGRFVVEGVAPGDYTIMIDGFSPTKLNVPDTNENLIYLPTLLIKEG
ncbi:fimbria/pilus outer membrane usher protein [Vibrio sp. Sgm 5]|uniref:fimbria/pilus outer membrane usher protein n=1 Tax=Vibrio sp. Sgm 5 TaxID=2994387 RepID=UPI0022490F19|nr:fimbria/pilus outer membrane usher protein [Vibrio sp. Sgm 5]MCX2788823.1 fimbria/pilus outer membrane usher protein [Vibrio sp. Sgm 5]